VVTRLRGASD